jgi:hypothetical protein
MIVRPNSAAHMVDFLIMLFQRGLDVLFDAHGETVLLSLVNHNLRTILKVFSGTEIEDQGVELRRDVCALAFHEESVGDTVTDHLLVRDLRSHEGH